MSLADNGSIGRSGVKTLGIRLEPDLHAQLSLIAQLRSTTITDEIKAALEAHVKAAKSLPELSGRADAVLADIDRDASARRAAIATLFGTTEPAAATPSAAPTGDPEPAPQPSGRARARRGGSEEAGSGPVCNSVSWHHSVPTLAGGRTVRDSASRLTVRLCQSHQPMRGGHL